MVVTNASGVVGVVLEVSGVLATGSGVEEAVALVSGARSIVSDVGI